MLILRKCTIRRNEVILNFMAATCLRKVDVDMFTTVFHPSLEGNVVLNRGVFELDVIRLSSVTFSGWYIPSSTNTTPDHVGAACHKNSCVTTKCTPNGTKWSYSLPERPHSPLKTRGLYALMWSEVVLLHKVALNFYFEVFLFAG